MAEVITTRDRVLRGRYVRDESMERYTRAMEVCCTSPSRYDVERAFAGLRPLWEK